MQIIYGKDSDRGFCSCWTDDHMGRDRKCGDNNSERHTFLSPAVNRSNFLYRHLRNVKKSHICEKNFSFCSFIFSSVVLN